MLGYRHDRRISINQCVLRYARSHYYQVSNTHFFSKKDGTKKTDMALGLLGGLGIAQTALGAFNSVMGIASNNQNLAWQREQLESQQNFGREMFEKQNQAENERLALQHKWNVEAAEKSQEYAKEMYNYTNYESQVEHMKNAGLNPALMNGGSGQGGQASAGAKQEAGQVMSPMGIQVALQAQQTAAQTNLINAQAKNVQSQTVRQEMENLIGSSIDLVEKISNIRKSKSDTEKVQNEIKDIQKNMEFVDETNEHTQERRLKERTRNRIAKVPKRNQQNTKKFAILGK